MVFDTLWLLVVIILTLILAVTYDSDVEVVRADLEDQKRSGVELESPYENTDEKWQAQVWEKPRVFFRFSAPDDMKQSLSLEPGVPGCVLLVTKAVHGEHWKRVWPHVPQYRLAVFYDAPQTSRKVQGNEAWVTLVMAYKYISNCSQAVLWCGNDSVEWDSEAKIPQVIIEEELNGVRLVQPEYARTRYQSLTAQ